MNVILESWGLSELSPVCEANDIKDLETLEEVLKCPEEVKKSIFTSIGLRLKLERKCKEHSKLQENIVLEIVNTAEANRIIESSAPSISSPIIEHSTSPPVVSWEDITNQQSADSSEKSKSNQKTVPTVPHAEESRSSKSTNNKRKHPTRGIDVNLGTVLEEHPIGRAILASYEYNQELSPTCKSYLCDIIVLHLLHIENLVATNDDFELLSLKIVDLFPNECDKTYYVPPIKKKDSKNNKAGISKGKLVDKYRNKCTFIRAANKLIKESEALSRESEYSEETQSAQRSKAWLVHNREAAGVLRHWDASYCLRQAHATEKKYVTMGAIFDNWPILKESQGYELIEKDFSKIYPQAEDSLILNWENIFGKLLALYEKNISEKEKLDVELLNSESPHMNQDTRTIIQLQLMATLLAPESNKLCLKSKQKQSTRTSTKSFWKPSSIEAKEGIVIHVKIPGDIENEVNKKLAKVSELGLPLQPFMIAVGSKVEEITKVYIRVDTTTYEVPSVLKGLDVLLKIFVTYNSQYPIESENIWYFIQWGIAGDVAVLQEKRINAMKTLALRLQPFIIVVGSDITRISSSYVCVDQILYKVDSTIAALDICFKVFHAFHAAYPPESEYIWLLLQEALYQFTTKWDKQIPYVTEIMSHFKNNKDSTT